MSNNRKNGEKHLRTTGDCLQLPATGVAVARARTQALAWVKRRHVGGAGGCLNNLPGDGGLRDASVLFSAAQMTSG